MFLKGFSVHYVECRRKIFIRIFKGRAINVELDGGKGFDIRESGIFSGLNVGGDGSKIFCICRSHGHYDEIVELYKKIPLYELKLKRELK